VCAVCPVFFAATVNNQVAQAYLFKKSWLYKALYQKQQMCIIVKLFAKLLINSCLFDLFQ
jgi:hypothetical protein